MYDPLPGEVMSLAFLAAFPEYAVKERLEREAASANHVYDALREASLEELEEHEEMVLCLFRALPPVLSFRLYRQGYGNLVADRREVEPRQELWRRVHRRAEAAFLEEMLGA